MVRLCYYTDCDEAVQTKVLEWVQTEEFRTRIGMPAEELRHAPGAETGIGRVHNWVIFVDKQPVGMISAKVQDQPSITESDDPADYPSLGTVTYIDQLHRGNGYAPAAKSAISEHDAAEGVRSFCCVIAADNSKSLKAIQKAGYECVRVEKITGKPDNLHFRRRR
ncbi:GNAT family N-acetyltransferase [Nocardia rhamnosiphila]